MADGLVDALRAAGCVFAEDEARLLTAAAGTPDELTAMVGRRVAGEPLEHVLGWADFCGIRIAVGPGVFVPRRRTQALVTEALAVTGPGSIVVDLCCGSGAVGRAVAAAASSVELHAVEIDPRAVLCAEENLQPVHGRVHEGDLYQALPEALEGRVDVLVVNAPYVPTGDLALMPTEARLHEPRTALDGGDDGLDIQRRVAAGANRWLAPGGHLLMETSQGQAQRSLEAVTTAGLDAQVATSEELEATVVVGRRLAQRGASSPAQPC